MDADDLVITLKKSLAKLSRTERRKAVELVGDVVRAAMFDDAAGDGYEIERCPRCGSTAVVKKGVSVNIIFTISTNAFSPIAPTRIHRIRQRGCAAFGA